MLCKVFVKYQIWPADSVQTSTCHSCSDLHCWRPRSRRSRQLQKLLLVLVVFLFLALAASFSTILSGWQKEEAVDRSGSWGSFGLEKEQVEAVVEQQGDDMTPCCPASRLATLQTSCKMHCYAEPGPAKYAANRARRVGRAGFTLCTLTWLHTWTWLNLAFAAG